MGRPLTMTFHEYPKAMYRKGVYCAVDDAAQEAEKAAEGWTDWHSDQAAMAAPEIEILRSASTEITPSEGSEDPVRRRGRPPKER